MNKAYRDLPTGFGLLRLLINLSDQYSLSVNMSVNFDSFHSNRVWTRVCSR